VWRASFCSHRSNQSSAPIYRIVVTTIGGETRFGSSVAKRLRSLGALLKVIAVVAMRCACSSCIALSQGDRRATGAGSELQDFDIENKLGWEALKWLYRQILGTPTSYANAAFADAQPHLEAMGLAEHANEVVSCGQARCSGTAAVKKFLNRLLGLTLTKQRRLFDAFTAAFDRMMRDAKAAGTMDTGIRSLNKDALVVTQIDNQLQHTDALSGAGTYLKLLRSDSGVSLGDAEARLRKLMAAAQAGASTSPALGELLGAKLVPLKPRKRLPGMLWSGFWRRKQKRKGGGSVPSIVPGPVIFAIEIPIEIGTVSGSVQFKLRKDGKWRKFRVFQPDGERASLRRDQRRPKPMALEYIWKYYDRVGAADIRDEWNEGFASRSSFTDVHVLAGAVLPVFRAAVAAAGVRTSRAGDLEDEDVVRKVHVVQAQLSTGDRVVGLQIPDHKVDELKLALAAERGRQQGRLPQQ
jgi:hypothetical protein